MFKTYDADNMTRVMILVMIVDTLKLSVCTVQRGRGAGVGARRVVKLSTTLTETYGAYIMTRVMVVDRH